MKDTIKILCSGDFAPLLNSGSQNIDPFQDIQKLISNANAHITNLECPITTLNQPIAKTGLVLKAIPENITLLKEAGVSIACMANNHIFDNGETGITDTMKICNEHGINTLGIVNRTDNKPHWLITEIKGKKIGFLNYCEHEFSVREPGLIGACGYNSIDAFYDISKLKSSVDVLVVIYHGGNEYYALPNPELKKTFHYLADLGADAVIGHHTHVYSGYEIYNDKPLVYSLGNFFFPLENEPESWHLGLLCMLNISDKIQIDLYPILQCEEKMKVSLVHGEKLAQLKENIDQLSRKIGNDDLLWKSWSEYSEKMRLGYLKQFPCLTLPIRILLKLGLPLSYIMPKKRLRLFTNLLNCQAHLEILKKALKEKGIQ